MKENEKRWTIVLLITIILIILVILLYRTKNTNQIESEIQKKGFVTNNEEEAFYKKVYTNNTLDEYYDDIAKKKNSEYEEYYFAKESYDFIELKMSYQNDKNKVLNITSNLKNSETNYNYEITFANTYLLIEGNNKDDYNCHIVRNNNVTEEEIKEYCEEIKQEIEQFKSRKKELLKQ